jgi:hypothetical protein
VLLIDFLFGKQNFQWTERVFLAGSLSLIGTLVIYGSLLVSHEQQYVTLAESFLRGKLYFISTPEHWADTAEYGGLHYWPLGPLPAVILMPLVWLFRLTGASVYQGYLSIPLSFLTGWMCFQLGRICNRTVEDSLWLTLAFCGASSYLSVAAISMSWPFAQVIAICLIFLSLHERLGRQRPWLVGLLLGLSAATRISAGLNILLFAGATLFCEREQKVKNFVSIMAGFAVPLVFLAAYNYSRFDSVFETGYNYQSPATGDFAETSLSNVILHLFIFFFGLPNASGSFPFVATNTFGMSVFLLSPWLVYLVSIKIDRFSVLAWRSTGQIQLGYRFLLDFLPIVIFLIARDSFGRRRVNTGFKTLVFLGFISTLYFLKSFIALIPTG